MKMILIAAAVLAAVAGALFVLVKPTAVVATVVSGPAVSAVPGSVTVRAEYVMELKPDVGGRVIQSELDPGKPVTAGSMLVQIDPTDLALEIERTESEYEAAKQRIAVGSSIKLELDSAREGLENLERLAKMGNYPLAELEKQRRNVKVIEQRLALEEVANTQAIAAFENTLKLKRRQLGKMTVPAPFDGVVSEVYARRGDLIGPGSTIALLISTSRTVEAKVSEENFAGIRIGQKATVRFLGYGNQEYSARVVKIMPTADPATQRYIVHLEVAIEPDKLVPGLTGEVNIIVGERQAQALIPRRALFGDRVFVVQDGRVRLRKVELGYESLNIAEITKGLAAGEQVIVDELEKYRDGDRVAVRVAQ